MKIKKNKVPIEIRRLAFNHLESVKDSDEGGAVIGAHIGGEVCPIYRPDIKDVAYYQFEVQSKADESIGFILVSAGEHDFPVAHWSFESLPISTILEEKAKKHGKKPAKLYKVDALSYVLEDDSGEEAARLGDLPGLLEGVPDNLSEFAGKISSSESVVEGGDTDDKPDKIKHKIKKHESDAPKIKIKDSGTWKNTKEQFGSSFKRHLEMHKNEAKKTWDTEKLIRKFGEGMFVGIPFLVPLLENGYGINVTGEAKAFVGVEIIKRSGCPDVARIICEDPDLGREANFSLKIKYDNNENEKLDFFIVTKDIPSNEKNITNSEEV